LAPPPKKPAREPNPGAGKVAWIIGLAVGGVAIAVGTFSLVFFVILG
jgi:hypothetical protein